MEIKTKDYSIWYDADTTSIHCKGFLRLDGMEEYRPIMDLLINVIDLQISQPADQGTNTTLNLCELEFLNSSGISMLSMFIVKVREKGNVHLLLRGSSKILWQTKSLKNLQRLMPSVKLEFV
jgi:hypothetical protein